MQALESSPQFRPLRLASQALAFVLLTLSFAPLVIAGGAIARRRTVPLLMRAWGRLWLAVAGVRVEVEPAAREELAKARRRVLTINHGSTLDMFVMAAVWPEDAIIVMKREFLEMPVLGIVVRFIDAMPLDRADHDAAMKTMREAARRVRRENRTLMVAPEGTRSRTGELQRFKLGAFHIAREAEAPIVPLVLHGARELWPMSQLHCEAGTVTIRVLPELELHAIETDDVHVLADRLHDAYAAELASMQNAIPVRGAPLRNES